jgi:Acetyltransferase (GNAT) domain
VIKFWPILPHLDLAVRYQPLMPEDFDWSTCLLSPPRFQALIGKMMPLARYIFDDHINSIEDVAKALLDPLSLYFEIYEDKKLVGYCSLQNMSIVHATFFDRRQRGREAALNKFALKIMRAYGLSILRAITPLTHSTSIALMKRMGWVKDGYYRHLCQRNGQWVDGVMFSATEKELSDEQLIRQSRPKNYTKEPTQPPGASAHASADPAVRHQLQPDRWDAADVLPVPELRPNGTTSPDLHATGAEAAPWPGVYAGTRQSDPSTWSEPATVPTLSTTRNYVGG